MRRLMIVGAALMATLVVSIAASAAMAVTLPSITFLPGGTSAEAVAKSTAATSLETVVGSKLVGSGVNVTLATKGGANGTYVSTFKGVKEGTNACKTGTEAAETVVIKGEYHLVTISEAPLVIGVWFLVPATTIACGTVEKPEKVKIKVEGSALSSFTGELNKDVTTFGGSLKGSKGKPEKTAFLNDAGETKNAELKSNFGLGAEASDENVAEALTFTSSPDITITG
jgi:hypothetical protein